MTNVIEFKSATKPIAQFVRIDDAHRKYGDLYAAGRFPIRRAVFDASRVLTQKELIAALKRSGVEIVLDTEVAELASREKYKTHVKKAPWAAAAEGKPLSAAYFDGTFSQLDLISWIARFAVENGVDTVLAPTHFLADRDYGGWLNLDYTSCTALRQALDREGGSRVAIDYPVIHTHTLLNQLPVRDKLVERIAGLPIDNIWVRASGLGNEPKPQTVKQFLASLYDLQRIGKPIVMDHVDGLMAQALLAFGGVSGVSHGIGERARFDAGDWHKEPQQRADDKKFSRATYIAVPGLGRRLQSKEFELLAGARGGHKYLGCQDQCCAHGVRDMLSDPRQHAAFQAIAPVRRLAEVPDLNREGFFLDKPLREAERLARNIKDLNPAKIDAEKAQVDLESLKRRLTEYHRGIGKFGDALSLLHDERGDDAPRARACEYRVGSEARIVKRENQ